MGRRPPLRLWRLQFIDGRWKPVAQALIDIYGLKDGSSVLDVGCGKAFLLYEMKKLLPGLEIAGFDISKHGLADARDRVTPTCSAIAPQDRYPLRRRRVRSRDLARLPAQPAPVRACRPRCGDRARRQEQVHHGRELSQRARAVQPRMLGADRGVDPSTPRSGSGSTTISATPATTSSSTSNRP